MRASSTIDTVGGPGPDVDPEPIPVEAEQPDVKPAKPRGDKNGDTQ